MIFLSKWLIGILALIIVKKFNKFFPRQVKLFKNWFEGT